MRKSNCYPLLEIGLVLIVCSYPEEVVITDEALGTPADGTSTPAGEPADDFFSSWDKPTIKRPSNPPSRTGTPLGGSRTASPFLNAPNANGAARPKSPSPLSSAATDAEKALPAPTAIRSTSSTAVRKGPTATGAKRTNILGAKKGQKLGAKKVGGDEIDFEAAEKAAKAEAERIEKLGYDPEAEAAEDKAKSPTFATQNPSILAPTPVSPPSTGYGNKQQHQRNPSEVERLGMGMGRLGFGQVGRPQSSQSSSAPAPKKLGFGAVGTPKAAAEGKISGAAICTTLTFCRRRRRLCTPEVWHSEIHLFRRVLWAQ
jgi:ADP-ribosylation factor GTPase-activating protein 2/3